jgi:2,4-dienoyl-CoA reductase-like NADH-dependent reductase (Old Yellow Enzyme family)
MAAHARFRFRSAAGLLAEAARLGLDVPYQEDVSPLLGRTALAGRAVPNRLAVLPMEGADAEAAGGPSESTRRRYRRYAAGGSGLIWVEATAVRPDGRSNPRQLLLDERTVGAFARLVDETRAAAQKEWGREHRPLLVLQLTHSGRFARPEGTPRPRIVQHNPHLDPLHGLPPDHPLVPDSELVSIRDDFVEAADLASAAGFDGVDVKACHGYLVSETLAAHGREDSRYGGPFANRTRLLLETVRLIREEIPGHAVTCRLSATDMVPFPYGFGMDPDAPERMDLAEAKALIGLLAQAGVGFLALSLGIPAWKPHFGRPFDTPVPGGPVPPEHPLEGIARHLRVASELQLAAPRVAVVGAGYTWLRAFGAGVGAAMVGAGRTSVVGWGRGALAYPDFAADLLRAGKLDPRKTCTTCSLCSHLLRRQEPVGCVVRDPAYKNAARGEERSA